MLVLKKIKSNFFAFPSLENNSVGYMKLKSSLILYDKEGVFVIGINLLSTISLFEELFYGGHFEFFGGPKGFQNVMFHKGFHSYVQ